MLFHLRPGDATRKMVIRVASSCSTYEDSISEDTVAIALDFSVHPTSHSINLLSTYCIPDPRLGMALRRL